MHQPNGHTHLWAILGDPISHTRAPEFFNPRILERGRDAFLIPLHVPAARLQAAIPVLASLSNLRGFIVTVPHKEAMASLCQELGPEARRVGAVNTVRIEPGARLVGEMFDGIGLMAALRAHAIEVRGRQILMLGAGGAARAIAFAFAAAGVARLTIANRARARAVRLAADVAAAVRGLPVEVGAPEPGAYDIVVNATSLGMHDEDPLPLEPDRLEGVRTLVDIIAVRDTRLMTLARARGIEVLGGRPMVDHQIDAQIDFLQPPAL